MSKNKVPRSFFHSARRAIRKQMVVDGVGYPDGEIEIVAESESHGGRVAKLRAYLVESNQEERVEIAALEYVYPNCFSVVLK